MTMIDTADSRFAKALAIADQAGGWLRLRDNSGHCKAVGIPSSRGDGRYYIVMRDRCDCEDQRRHPDYPCKHRQALAIVLAYRQSEPQPARLVIDGLRTMALARRYSEIFGEKEDRQTRSDASGGHGVVTTRPPAFTPGGSDAIPN